MRGTIKITLGAFCALLSALPMNAQEAHDDSVVKELKPQWTYLQFEIDAMIHFYSKEFYEAHEAERVFTPEKYHAEKIPKLLERVVKNEENFTPNDYSEFLKDRMRFHLRDRLLQEKEFKGFWDSMNRLASAADFNSRTGGSNFKDAELSALATLREKYALPKEVFSDEDLKRAARDYESICEFYFLLPGAKSKYEALYAGLGNYFKLVEPPKAPPNAPVSVEQRLTKNKKASGKSAVGSSKGKGASKGAKK